MNTEIVTNKRDIKEYFAWAEETRLSDPNRIPELLMTSDLPEPMFSICEREKYLLPKHVSHELLKELLNEICCDLDRNFIMDEVCSPTYDNVIKYIREDPKFPLLKPGYSLDKGLLIKGKIGCGKTLLIKGLLLLLYKFAIRRDHHKHGPLRTFKFRSANIIAQEYSLKGFEIIRPNYHFERRNEDFELLNNHLFIDDIGSEPIVGHFGNRVNVIGELIQLRYDQKDYITHATTNLDALSLKSFYDERVFSRIKEMFNDITMDGDDRRF